MLDSVGDGRGQSPSHGQVGLTSGSPPAPPAPPAPPPAAPAPARGGQHALWQDVGLLVGGAGLSGALLAGFVPVLSRLYTPEAFGVLAVFASLVAVLLTLGSLSYESAIPLAKCDAQAANTLALAITVVVLISAVVCLSLPALEVLVTDYLNCPQLKAYLLFLPIAFLGGSLYQALSGWALRDGLFSGLAKTRVGQSLGVVGTQVALGLGGIGIGGLIIGETLGRSIGVGTLWREVREKVPWREVTRFGVLSAANRYKRFPLYSAPAGVLTALGTQVPVIVLAALYGPVIAGVYAMTTRILSLPLTLIGGAIGQVLITRAARVASDEAQIQQLTRSAALGTIALGLLLYGAAAAGGPGLFAFTLGDQWEAAGGYARVLAPWYTIWLTGKSLNGLLTVREWQPTILLYSALECMVRSTSLWFGAKLGGADLAITLLGLASFVLGLFAMNRFFRAGFTSLRSVMRELALPVVATATAFAVPSLIWSGNDITATTIRIALFIVGCIVVEARWPLLRPALRRWGQC